MKKARFLLTLTWVIPVVAPAPGLAQGAASGAPPSGAPQGIPVTDITFEPINAAHPICPPFGSCPPGSQITTEYIDFGVDFTPQGGNPPVGVFEDPPEKFGGVNAQGVLDLITDSCGTVVLPGTTTQGLTDFLAVAGGFVGGPNDLLLEVFDVNGSVLGSSIADDGQDADGDLIAEVEIPAGNIASFCLSTPTGDTHGMHFVYLNDPSPVAVELQSFDVE